MFFRLPLRLLLLPIISLSMLPFVFLTENPFALSLSSTRVPRDLVSRRFSLVVILYPAVSRTRRLLSPPLMIDLLLQV
ncbi:hypothetical protein K474DRAFT_1052036 [Panus rudis PR-1116 ss-1]|nr:hypothetical protein K474DRAFT_1052036 [Panus rudis PR-1116 ss-1]